MFAPPEVAQTIIDPSAYADGRIHGAFAQLRREAPLSVVRADGYDPFWAVTRHADIMEVERRSADFSSGDGPVTLMSREAVARAAATGFQGPRTLVQLDGAEHLALRQLTQGWFMPQNLRKLEARIREIARASIDRMAALGGE